MYTIHAHTHKHTQPTPPSICEAYLCVLVCVISSLNLSSRPRPNCCGKPNAKGFAMPPTIPIHIQFVRCFSLSLSQSLISPINLFPHILLIHLQSVLVLIYANVLSLLCIHSHNAIRIIQFASNLNGYHDDGFGKWL